MAQPPHQLKSRMGRSVVRAGAARCPGCSLPPRWCICDAIPPVDTHLHVHVLIHHNEHHKPSSTGKLVARVVAGTNRHIYKRESRFFPASGFPAETLPLGSDLWILHPNGELLPAAAAPTADPRSPHILLLDGTWRQAGEMLHAVEGMGRCVCLPEPTAEPKWPNGISAIRRCSSRRRNRSTGFTRSRCEAASGVLVSQQPKTTSTRT